MTEKDDQLLKHFFSEHTIKVLQDNFSKSVMQHLPHRNLLILKVWQAVCMLIVVLILIFGNTFHQVYIGVESVLHSVLHNSLCIVNQAPSFTSLYLSFCVIVVLSTYYVVTAR